MNSLKNSKYIFVDYFDTLVYRSIFPDMTKSIWADKLSLSLDFAVDKNTILMARLTAEQNLIQRFKREIYTYEQLCNLVWLKLRLEEKIDNQSFFYLSLNIEENIELETQKIDTSMLAKLNKLKMNGKKIILVSDFYLGLDSYKKFFKALGIEDFFDDVYISSDCGACKSDGSLYLKIIKDKSILANKVFMIGDNKISDYRVPKKLGLSVKRIVNKKQKRYYNKIEKQVNNNLFIKKIVYNKYPFANYSFSLYLFCNNLYMQCCKRSINKVFFFAREGAYLKKLFDKYIENKTKKIKTEYLYVSRNSTYLPSLKQLDKETFSGIFREYKNISIDMFLRALSFSDEEIRRLLLADSSKIIENFSESEEFKRLKKNCGFVELYEGNRIKAKANFSKYLEKFDIDEHNMCVVDVGWKGSIQDNFFNFFNGKKNITGYYIGLRDFGSIEKNNEKYGLLFDWVTGVDNNISSDVFAYAWHNYEVLLVAKHGKAVCYNDYGEPVLEDDEDTLIFQMYSEKIQEDVFNKFNEILDVLSDTVVQKDAFSIFEDLHKKMFYKLSFKELKILCGMDSLHRDGFVDYYGGKQRYIKYILKGKFRPYFRMKRYINYKNCVAKGKLKL